MNPGGVRRAFFPGSWILLRGTDCFIPYHTTPYVLRCTSYLGQIGIDYIVESSIGRRVGTTKVHRTVYEGTIVGDFRVFRSQIKGKIIIFGKIEVPRGANRCEFVGTTRYLTCDE